MVLGEKRKIRGGRRTGRYAVGFEKIPGIPVCGTLVARVTIGIKYIDSLLMTEMRHSFQTGIIAFLGLIDKYFGHLIMSGRNTGLSRIVIGGIEKHFPFRGLFQAVRVNEEGQIAGGRMIHRADPGFPPETPALRGPSTRHCRQYWASELLE